MISTKPSSRSLRAFQACLPVLFLAFALAVLSAPQPVHAMTVFAPPPDQPRIGQPAPKSMPKSEQEEIDSYRHSATVEWCSRLLHTDVETTARIFEFINFAIIVLAVGIPLFKVLPKTFRQRSARLGAELEVAQAKTADANHRLSAVEAKLAGLDAEIAAIHKQVEEDMRADEARNKALIQQETARIVAAAEQEIVMAGSQAQRGLKQFAADLAIDRALSTLTIDAATDRALFAEFALDAASDGGKKKRSSKGDRN